jgi:hypothetical protein
MKDQGHIKRDQKMNEKIVGYVPLMSHGNDRQSSSRQSPSFRNKTIEERIRQVTQAFGLKNNNKYIGDGKNSDGTQGN